MSISLIPGEFSAFTIAIAVISGFIVFFGYVSMFLKERLFLSEAFIAVIVGIIAGPLVANGINPYNWEGNDEITKQLTRCVIAVQVMAVGIELPKHYLQKDWQTVLMLLLPVMLFMWLISGMIIFFLIPPINFLESLVIAACVCPTDPILANSVVKGRFADKHVPVHIRNALSAESGANDGMGFPFLFLAIFLLGEDHVGKAVAKWIYETCLFQIALSCVIGVVVGYIARKALQWSNTKKIIDKPSFLSFAIALALFLMSMTGFSGSDDVLACFAAGNAFSWDDWFRQETKEAHFQDVIDMLLNISIFVYIGALIPWNEFNDPDLGLTPWRLVLMAILILLFRRLPAVLLLKRAIPAMKTYREALFSGWFGPMGVGAVFLSKIAREEMLQVYPTPAGQAEPLSIRLINPIVLFIVLSSVFVHGTTIPLFKLGRKIQTRTLSHTSAKSTSKTVSKWYNDKFGGGKSKSMDVLITERNTLRNITHRPTLIMGGNNDTTMQDGYAIDMYDYSDIREEDLLPDDRVRQSANNSAFEAQNIRFVEPVVSRTNIPITKSHQAYEGKRRQSIVDQVLAWFHKRSSLKPAEVAAAERQHHEDQASDSAVTTAADDATAKDSNTVQSSPSPSSVQIFDERNKLVVEDGHGRGTAFVIDKSMPDWRDRVKLKIRQLQEMLQETAEQDDDDDLKEGDLTFHSSSKTSSAPSTTH